LAQPAKLIFDYQGNGLVKRVPLDNVDHESLGIGEIHITHAVLHVLIDNSHADHDVVVINHRRKKPLERLDRVPIIVDTNHEGLCAPLVAEAIVLLIECDAGGSLVQVRVRRCLEGDMGFKSGVSVSTWRRTHSLGHRG
jgi:hypothetical protein